METIIKEKIMSHLAEHDLIKPSQHGFMPGRLCATNLILFQEVLTQAIDNGIPADIFYLDFAKAFDKVQESGYLSSWRRKASQAG
jgi:hypothetical protein